MDGFLEFHGRLSRVDKRPANPGAYRLQFQLHGHQKGGGKRDRVYWEETLDNINVSAGGFYRVILGRKEPVPANIFSNGPRWMSIRVVRGGHLDLENGLRVPVIGQHLRLGTAIEKTGIRLTSLEDRVNTVASAAPRVEQFQTRINRLGESISAVQARITGLEDSTERRAIVRRIEALTTRLDQIDKDEGRLDRIESEVEDLVGPDGDVIDLNDRMDRVEGRAPELIQNIRERERDAPQQLQLRDFEAVIERLALHLLDLEATVEELRESAASTAKAGDLTPEALGVVRRAGDVMTGGLTINRGGLDVLSGGVNCRGATVTSLEASNLIKAPKMIAEAFELRGDFTVDSVKRVLQVRDIEGRQASARRDGALHLNGRGGSEVVIGNEKSARGAQVHGSVRADSLVAQSTGGLAQLFKATGDLKAGDVVRVNDAGERVVRVRKTGDPRVVGVVTDKPGILLGGENRSGVVCVAVSGVVMCRVDATVGPIRAGDLLMAGTITGHACRTDEPAPGTVLGKALGTRLKGRGTIPILLGAR